jgi:TatD DNase family protein
MIEGAHRDVIDRAVENGVTSMITVGTTLQTSRQSVEISRSEERVYSVIGVHPHDASSLDDSTLADIKELAKSERVVGIGETGLDFYRDLSPRPDQLRAFESQIALAKELELTLVIHMRDAHEETFGALDRLTPPTSLVFHCFSGGVDEAKIALDLGGYLSFAGNITYSSANDLRAAAVATPLERLLLETDAPFLAPVPQRGKPNEPSLLPLTGKAIAELKGLSVDGLSEATSTNARTVFGF